MSMKMNEPSSMIFINGLLIADVQSKNNSNQTVGVNIIEDAQNGAESVSLDLFQNDFMNQSNLNDKNSITIDLKDELQKCYRTAFTCLRRSCGLDFEKKEEIVEHLMNEHKLNYENLSMESDCRAIFKCLVCCKKLESYDQVMIHLSRFHFKNEVKNNFICTQSNCFLAFENESELRKHKQMHTKIRTFKCDQCDYIFDNPTALKYHLRVHENPKFKCVYCEQLFIKNSLLIKHLSEMHKNEDKTISCPNLKCDRKFSNNIHLQRHLKDAHKNENLVFKCSNCDKTFLKESLKRNHEKNVHPVTSHCCTFQGCSKSFKTMSKLKRHYLIHSESKIHKCTFENCQDSFNRLDHLKSHLKFHENKRDLFSCNVPYCHSKFKSEISYNKHKRAHFTKQKSNIFDEIDNKNEYKCDICEGSFNKKSKLISHLKTHIETKTINNGIPNNSNNNSLLFNLHPEDLIDNNSNTSSRCSSDSSFDSIINDSNVLDKYGIIDIRGKLDNYGNYFLSQPHANKSTKHHVITINSDDEEYAPTCVVIENLSGCARTDYKFNRTSIEINKLRKRKEGTLIKNVRSFHSFQSLIEFNLNSNHEFSDNNEELPLKLPKIDTLLSENKRLPGSNIINENADFDSIKFKDTISGISELLQE